MKMLNAFVVIVVTLGTIAHGAANLDTVPIAKLLVEEDSRDETIEDIEPDARYTIEDVKFGDLQTKVLKNTETGEYVQVVIDLGGRIEDLVLRGSDRKLRSVLLTHHNNVTAIKENVWWKNAILLPYANRIDGVRHYNDVTVKDRAKLIGDYC